MDKKILFTTSHPAPYWDIIYNDISKNADITVYYNRIKDKDKAWKNQNNVKGKVESEISLKEKINDIKNIDFAVLGGWNNKNNLLFMFLLILFRKPFAFFSDVPDENSITLFKKIFKKIFFMFVPFLYLTGKTGKEHYQKHYGINDSKIKIFPYGINLPDEKLIKEKIDRRINEMKNVKDSKLKIFIANRFLERKGYKTVYEAFKLLNEKGLLNKFDIVIAGKGEFFDEYEKKFNNLQSNIKLLGWIEFDEYNNNLDNCDIYLHSSYFEPYGIPIVDAMLNGKIVIASDGVMSALDNIKNEENGFIYSKYDEKALCQILESFFYKNIDILHIGEKAKMIRNKFEYTYFDTIFSSFLKKV